MLLHKETYDIKEVDNVKHRWFGMFAIFLLFINILFLQKKFFLIFAHVIKQLEDCFLKTRK